MSDIIIPKNGRLRIEEIEIEVPAGIQIDASKALNADIAIGRIISVDPALRYVEGEDPYKPGDRVYVHKSGIIRFVFDNRQISLIMAQSVLAQVPPQSTEG